MTPRERILAAFNHQPGELPFSWGFGINAPAKRALFAYLGLSPEQGEAYLQSLTDIRHVAPRYVGPPDREIPLPGGERVDYWGVIRRPVSYGPDVYHEICHYPLEGVTTASQLSAYSWPSPDWFDYSGIARQIEAHNAHTQYAIQAGGGNIFESAWYMRGFEQIFIDMIDEPELVEEILTRVTDFFIERATRILEAGRGKIDLFFTADDIGGQTGPLLSPRMWESRLKPHHQRLNAALHALGAKVLYHSDGAVGEMIEGLIEMGIDALEAVQLDAAGMDPNVLKQKAGAKLAFHGGISVQSLLPFGTHEEVEAEVARIIGILSLGGGYIPAPAHAIQAGTPPENIAAMLRAVGRL